MPETSLIAAGIGIITGILLSITGTGGTIIAIPLLMFCLSIPITEAMPVALLAILCASIIGVWQGIKRGCVRYRAAMLMGSLGLAMAPVGVYIATLVPMNILEMLLTLLLCFIAWTTWTNITHTKRGPSNQHAICEQHPVTSKIYWTAPCTSRLVITGVISGFLSGLLGIGGGFLIIPALKKVTQLDHAHIVATTLAIVAMVSGSAVLSHLYRTSMNKNIALPFVAATMLVMFFFSIKKRPIPEKLSQQFFAIICLFAAATLQFHKI